MPALPQFMKPIEDAIAEVEGKTSAEVVVALAPWSGTYRDADYLTGGVLAFLGLLVVLFVPWDFLEYAIPFEILFLFFAGTVLSRRVPWVRVKTTTSRRREAQVTAEASRAFFEEEVSATVGRTGVLFYISLGEQSVRVLPDHGILARIPKTEWIRLQAEVARTLGGKDWVERLAEAIRSVGNRLAGPFPVAPDDVNEIPNTVRVRR